MIYKLILNQINVTHFFYAIQFQFHLQFFSMHSSSSIALLKNISRSCNSRFSSYFSYRISSLLPFCCLVLRSFLFSSLPHPCFLLQHYLYQPLEADGNCSVVVVIVIVVLFSRRAAFLRFLFVREFQLLDFALCVFILWAKSFFQ